MHVSSQGFEGRETRRKIWGWGMLGRGGGVRVRICWGRGSEGWGIRGEVRDGKIKAGHGISISSKFSKQLLLRRDIVYAQLKNKAREKQRQLTLKQRDASGSKPGRAAAAAACPQQPAQKKLPAAKRRRLESQVDDAAVVEDYRQLKKLKHGRITQASRVTVMRSCSWFHSGV